MGTRGVRFRTFATIGTTVLASVGAVLPGASPAFGAASNTAIVEVTFRGDDAWFSHATIDATGAGPRGIELTCAGGDVVASHPTPPTGPVTLDLTDVRRRRVQDCTEIRATYGSSLGANLTYGTIADAPLITLDTATPGLVTGVTSTSATYLLRVTLTSGDQVIARDVTPAADGTWTEDFSDTFDGTWEFGASVQADLSLPGTSPQATLRATRYLPDAELLTQKFTPLSIGGIEIPGQSPPPSLAITTGITPGRTVTGFDGSTGLVNAGRVELVDLTGSATVSHLGQTLTLTPPDPHQIDSCDLDADTCSGTSQPEVDLVVDVESDAGDVIGTAVTTDVDGAWTVDVSAVADATVLVVKAALAHTDGAAYLAQHVEGDLAAAVSDVVIVDASDDLVVMALTGAFDDEYTIVATTGDSRPHTFVGTILELFSGIAAEDFSPPLDLASGYLLQAKQNGGDREVAWQVPALTVGFTDGATTGSGSATPGTDVTVLTDIPVIGQHVIEATASGAGTFSFDSGAVATDGSGLLATTAFPATTGGFETGLLFASSEAAPLDTLLGSAGGRAAGLGTYESALVEFARLASFLENGVTAPQWRLDVVADRGGAADLTRRTRLQDPSLRLGAATLAVTAVDQVELLEGGQSVRALSTQVGLYVPFEVNGSFEPTDPDALTIGYLADLDDGWENVPTPGQTVCLTSEVAEGETLDARCRTFPIPFVHTTTIPHLGFDPTDVTIFEGNPVGDLAVTRVSGPEGSGRIQTAIALSQAGFESAEYAILARADDFPDALAAAPLAAALGAPILLNPQDTLDDDVSAELERLGVAHVYLMGGPTALAPEVQSAVAAQAGIETATRVAGSSRFATAVAAAELAVDAWRADGFADAGDRVLVALGSHPDDPARAWPDALAAGQLAAHARAPIVLVDRDSVPAVVKDSALLASCPCRLTAIGGPGALPETTFQQLAGEGRTLDRIGGTNRFHTSLLVAQEAIAVTSPDRAVVVATGENFPDGLAAASVAFARNGVMVLVPTADLGVVPQLLPWFLAREGATRTALIAGGPGAVSDEVLAQITAALDGTTRSDTEAAAATG